MAGGTHDFRFAKHAITSLAVSWPENEPWQDRSVLNDRGSRTEGREYSAREIGLAAAFGALIFLLLWLRRPDSLLNAQFWAEDGGLFFREQFMGGFGSTFAQPYSGYLHTVPRLIALLTSPLPVRWIPWGFNVSALSIAAVSCSAFFWPCFRRIIVSDALRAVCCIAMAAAIPVGGEMIAAVCNLQWYLSVLSLLLIVTGGRDVTKKAMEICLSIAQALIALSAAATLLFFPFLLWQLKSRPGWLKTRPAVHLAALCLQVLVILRFQAPGTKPLVHFNTLFLATITGFISRCVLAPAIGAKYLLRDSEVALFTKLALTLIVCVALVTLLIVRLWKSRRVYLIPAALYVGVGSVLMVMSGRRFAESFLNVYGIEHTQGERYFFIGSCMAIFSAALTIDTLGSRMRPGLAAGLLASLFTLGTLGNFAVKPFDDFHWNVSAARIEQWKAARDRHEHLGTILAPINPAPWNVVLEGGR
jgi:hypothetical protein